MRIKGVPPTTTIRHIGQSLSVSYRDDGTAIVKRYPPKRPGKLHPKTEQQVALWDDALAMERWAIPSQRQYASNLAGKTGFYTRDILIAACYGHMVSWPGWGIYPNGGTGPAVAKTSKGQPTFPPRPVNDPQPINALRSLAVTATHAAITVDATTWHPTTPLCARFCCAPTKILVDVRRRGNRVPHGFKLFFPCLPTIYTPTTGYGTAHHWDLPPSDFDPPCDDCALVFLTEETAPVLSWTSLPEACPVRPPPTDHGYWYFIVGFITGPNGFTPDPGDVAQLDADLASFIACFNNAYTVVASGSQQLTTDFQLHTTQVIGNLAIPCPPGIVPCETSPAFVNPSPQVAQPGEDQYTWWLVAHWA